MKIKLFSVYDSKVEQFLQPLFARTTAEAMRMWKSACAQEDSNFYKYAGDYTLFEIGTFDDSTAELRALLTPVNLGLAIMQIEPPAIFDPGMPELAARDDQGEKVETDVVSSSPNEIIRQMKHTLTKQVGGIRQAIKENNESHN